MLRAAGVTGLGGEDGSWKHVYAGSNDDTVRALRASDSTPVWQFTAGGPVESQIAVADGMAYAGSNDFRVYALK